MAGKEQPIIIKKKKGGGHGGAHGGAWKVAYADFVTAMMCFFLVMWLMGADEETKSSIAHYFNHPNTPWKAGADPNSKSVHPMGEKDGAGESIQNGLDGFWPEDLIERPRPHRDMMKENKTISRMLEDLLEGKIYGMDVTSDHVRFSLPEKVVFAPGTATLTPESKKSLATLGEVLKNFSGYIMIEGHTDNRPIAGGKFRNNWELSFARAMVVMDYFSKNHNIAESRMIPQASGPRRALASNKEAEGREKNRRVEFTLLYDLPE